MLHRGSNRNRILCIFNLTLKANATVSVCNLVYYFFQLPRTRMNSDEYGGISGGDDVPCAGCGVAISDRYYLSAVNRRWHVTCLRCCACQRQLDATIMCYINNSNIYCAHDFRR